MFSSTYSCYDWDDYGFIFHDLIESKIPIQHLIDSSKPQNFNIYSMNLQGWDAMIAIGFNAAIR